MTLVKNLVYFAGIYSIGFAIFHAFFWRLFGWKNTLQKTTYLNRGILQIANCQLIYFFLFVAVICIGYPDELLNTLLGRAFLTGISLFWLSRTVVQIIYLRRLHTWLNLFLTASEKF